MSMLIIGRGLGKSWLLNQIRKAMEEGKDYDEAIKELSVKTDVSIVKKTDLIRLNNYLNREAKITYTDGSSPHLESV